MRAAAADAPTADACAADDEGDGIRQPRHARVDASFVHPAHVAGAARVFCGLPTALLLLTALPTSVIMRLRGGPVGWIDAAVVVGIAATQPLIEWAIHVYILHFRPRRIGPLRLDIHGAKYHRAHHRDPWDLRYVVIPMRTLFTSAGVVFTLGYVVLPSMDGVWTLGVVSSALALCYEWVHFLIHTSYRPRGAHMNASGERIAGTTTRTSVRFGVSRVEADRWLKTSPDPADVPKSPTARTLGGIDDGDDRTADADPSPQALDAAPRASPR